MTIDLVNPGLWGIGDKLTSAQQNALDENITFALDKRAGETDILESVVQAADAGRIVQSVFVGSDADTTISVADGMQFIRVGTLTAARVYTLSTTNAVDGDVVTVFLPVSTYTCTVKTGSTSLFVLGGSRSEGMVASFVYDATTVAWKRLLGRGPTLAAREMTISGTFTVPSWCTRLTLIGCGGGGGGGGGATAAANNDYYGGGGGGGSAANGVVSLAVTPGDTHTVTIGSGGVGGSAGADGANGTDTSFGTLATFFGAKGGKGGDSAGILPPSAMMAHGGCCAVAQKSRNLSTTISGYTTWNPTSIPSGIVALHSYQQLCEGGAGVTANLTAESGAPNTAGGYAGGAGGANGTLAAPDIQGGGGGGGGAAGPFGVGGAGGAGGNGTNPGAGAAGSAGSTGSSKSGAGGGGGGGGGAGTVSGGAGGAGGDGADGRLYVIYTVGGE